MSEEENVQKSPELIAAELRKLQMEATRAEREAQLFAAQTSRELAQVDRAKHENAMNDLRLRQEKVRFEDSLRNSELAQVRHNEAMHADKLKKATDSENGIFHFKGPVMAPTVANIRSQLAQWHRTNPGSDIEVIFNSPGGSVIDGMELFDYLRDLSDDGHKIITGVRGMAASMAGILVQAGDVRWIGGKSYLMIHELSAMTGGKIGEMEDAVDFYKKISSNVVDIFVNRATQAGKAITREWFITQWDRRDWWMSSDESLGNGFVDEVR